MKLASYVLILLTLCSAAFAQKKGTPPAPERSLPGKDPVVAISTIDAGKSRNYNCKGAKVRFAISGDAGAGDIIAIQYNGKSIAAKHTLSSKVLIKNLALQKDGNMLVLSPAGSNTKETFNARITVQDAAIKYAITASLKKGMNDTIILKKR